MDSRITQDINKALLKEIEFAELLKLLHPECHVLVTIGKDEAFDVQCGNWTYELKTDYMYEKTGNIAIEYRYRSKPSGLFASRATYFTIELPSKYILIDRENFLKWLKPNHNRFKKVKGRDNKWSELLLIKPEDVPKNDTEIGLISMELKK